MKQYTVAVILSIEAENEEEARLEFTDAVESENWTFHDIEIIEEEN